MSGSREPLQKQILSQVIPVVIVLLLLLTFAARYYVVESIREVIQQRLDRGAKGAAQNTEAYIEFVTDACRATAENDVVVNGVIDMEYRAAVTDPFIRSIRLPGRGSLGVVLADYRGRMLCATNETVSQAQLSAEQVQSVINENVLVFNDAQTITIAVPVEYANRPEALLIARYSLAPFLSHIGSIGAKGVLLFAQDDRVICSTGDQSVMRDGDELVTPNRWLIAASPISMLPAIRVAVLESESVALRAAHTVTNTLMVTMGVVLAMSLFIVYLTSRLAVEPTTKLLHKIDNVRETSDLSLRVEELGAKEFVELGKKFNAMLSELQQTTVSAERFRKSEERLSLALDFGQVGLWDWNVQTGKVFYSKSLKRQLGYDESDAWNHVDDWESRLHPDDHDAAIKVVENHFADPSNEYVSTFRIKNADGSFRWIQATGKAEFDDTGQPLRMLGVHIDIHSEVEYKKSLEQSNRELEQFAYVASHDLQEPLRKVSSFCALLENEYADVLSGDGAIYMEYIVDGATRMQTLIRDLLAFSRAKSESQQLQETDAQRALETAIDNLDHTINGTGATIVADDLPTIWANTARLVQVFQNLIGNGLKYNKSDSPEVRITVNESENDFVFSIQDNGIGIKPEFHKRIFGIFKRLHNRSEYAGTGIGLAICKRIVEQWGGQISIESEPEVGSTFSFTIPKVTSQVCVNEPVPIHEG